MMKKLIALLAAVMVIGTAFYTVMPVNAAEFTVTETSAVLYSNDDTKVYQLPDASSTVVTQIASGLPVAVTGITSNGWFRISLNGTYYVPGGGLEAGSAGAASTTDISALTKGTFSFFKGSQLSSYTKTDVEDMDANTYIKYLDSYLKGYALIENCILQDSGKKLETVYAEEAALDSDVAAMSMQTYLIYYRNNYLSDSLLGPFRTQKDLKLALNRAIRYDIGAFYTVYKSTSVGSSESKMTDLLESVADQIEAEQGVEFTYSMEYGDYTAGDGSTGTGWIIEFTKNS